MQRFRWIFLILSGAAGLALGRWFETGDLIATISTQSGSKPAEKNKAPAKPEKPTAPGEAPNYEEAVTESDLKALLKLKTKEEALEAFVRYAAKNPARAIDLAMSIEGLEWSFIQSLVQRMPEYGEIIMDALKRHENFWRPSPLLDEIFLSCARTNPGRAWREAEALGVGALSSVVDVIARGWAQKSPEEALKFTSSITRHDYRHTFTQEVLREWSKKEGAAVLTWLATQPDQADLLAMIQWDKMQVHSLEQFQKMMELMPPEALESPLGFDTQEGAVEMAGKKDSLPGTSWLTRMDWISSLPPGKARAAAYTAVAKHWIFRDPEKALPLLAEVTHPGLRAQLQSIIAGYRASASVEDGRRYAESITDETERKMAQRSVALTWAQQNPEAAATMLLKQQSPDNMLSLFTIIQKWAELNPEAAIVFAQANPASTGGVSLLSIALGEWARNDPLNASSWLSQQPAGTARDQAVAAFVSTASRSEPEGSMEWAASIQDPRIKQQAMMRTMSAWASQDRSRAAAWLENASLYPALRQMLSAPLTPRSPRNLMDGIRSTTRESQSGLTIRH